MKQKTVTCLWFDRNGLEAAKFYVSVFKGNSKITGISYYGKGMHLPEGTVLTVTFTLRGQEYMILNGGPGFKFSEAISMVLNCETQKEIDYFWKKLSQGGKTVECGWLKDKFGLSWQVMPAVVHKIITGRDFAKRDRVMQVVMGMNKPDLKKLLAAAAGKKAK